MPEKKKTKRLKVRAKEMLDADIEYISLVDRGANRMPIKIIKSDEVDPKMTTHNIFKTEIDCHVASIEIKKGEGFDNARKILSDLGFETKYQEEGDESIKFIQKNDVDLDFDEDETEFPLQLSEDVTFYMTAKAADFSSLSSTFADAIKKAQFFPALGASLDAIHNVIVTNVTMAEEIDKESISKSLEDFSKHIMKLVESLPEQVIKAEQALRKGAAGSTDLADGQDNPNASAATTETEEEDDDAKAKAGDPNPSAESASNQPGQEAGAASADNADKDKADAGDGGDGGTPAASEEGAEADGDDDDEEEGEESEVTKMLKGVSTKLDEIAERQTDIEKKVEQAVNTANEAKESADAAKEKAQKTAVKTKKFVRSHVQDVDGDGAQEDTRKSGGSAFDSLDGLFFQ